MLDENRTYFARNRKNAFVYHYNFVRLKTYCTHNTQKSKIRLFPLDLSDFHLLDDNLYTKAKKIENRAFFHFAQNRPIRYCNLPISYICTHLMFIKFKNRAKMRGEV
jgi:hypothetical protein